MQAKDQNEPRVNDKIKAREVRVKDDNGEQLGVYHLVDALRMAAEQGLDLVEVASNAKPPVCQITDYGKYKYFLKQKLKESKKNSTQIQVKEVKFRPKTDEHDVQFKLKHILRFLAEGNKAKVSVSFRGREIAHKDRGEALLHRIIEDLKEEATVEIPPKLEGRSMIMILVSKK